MSSSRNGCAVAVVLMMIIISLLMISHMNLETIMSPCPSLLVYFDLRADERQTNCDAEHSPHLRLFLSPSNYLGRDRFSSDIGCWKLSEVTVRWSNNNNNNVSLIGFSFSSCCQCSTAIDILTLLFLLVLSGLFLLDCALHRARMAVLDQTCNIPA